MLSLRSLCLLKFHSLGQEVPDLSLAPPSIIKDLKIMKLVNTNFVGNNYYSSTIFDDEKICRTALKLEYDGVNWNISYYHKKFNEDSCYECDFVESDLEHFIIEENKLVTDFFPLGSDRQSHWEVLGFGAINYPWFMKMIFSFDVDEQGTKGILSFRSAQRGEEFWKELLEVEELPEISQELFIGLSDEKFEKLNSDLGFEDLAPHVFTSNMVVELNNGERKVNLTSTNYGKVVTLALDETSVPIEQSITEAPGPCSCNELEEDDTDSELEEDDTDSELEEDDTDSELEEDDMDSELEEDENENDTDSELE